MRRELAGLTDEEVLLRCRQDARPQALREAVSELAGRHHEALIRYLRAYTQTLESAEDLAQEALVRLYRHAASYDPEAARVRTWLYRIATNLALNAIRDRKRRPTLVSGEAPGSDGDDGGGPLARAEDVSLPGPPALAARRELGERVREALEALPDHYRAAVLLCDLEGLAYAEAAEALETKVGTIRSRLFRGREMLAKVLAPLVKNGDL